MLSLPSPCRLQVVCLYDDHVAAVAAAPAKIARTRAVVAQRRHHLEKRVADRQDGVVESEKLHARIVKWLAQIKVAPELLDCGSEIVSDEPMTRLARSDSPFAKASAARLVVAAPMTEQKKAT